MMVTTPRSAGVRLTCIALAVSLASGCSSVQRVTPGEGGLKAAIRPGDKVRIHRHDRPALDVLVTAVTDQGLVGRPDQRERRVPIEAASELVTVPYRDIERVERYELEKGSTAVVAGGLVLAVVTVAFAIWFGGQWGKGTAGAGASSALPQTVGR
jgi:uncharacterized protein YceK